MESYQLLDSRSGVTWLKSHGSNPNVLHNLLLDIQRILFAVLDVMINDPAHYSSVSDGNDIMAAGPMRSMRAVVDDVLNNFSKALHAVKTFY